MSFPTSRASSFESVDELEAAAARHDAESEEITFSFAVGGWLQCYSYGSAKALVEHLGEEDTRFEGLLDLNTPKKYDEFKNVQFAHEKLEKDEKRHQEQEEQKEVKKKKIKYCGTSAGAMCAAAISLGADFDQMLEYSVDSANHARSKWIHALTGIRGYVETGVRRFAVNIFLSGPGSPASPVPNLKIPNSTATSAASSSSSSTFSSPSVSADFSSSPQLPETIEEEIAKLETGPGGWVSDGTVFVFPPHLRAQIKERLEIYATAVPSMSAIRFGSSGEFPINSTLDLEESLAASTCLVPLVMPFKLRRQGIWVIDGGAHFSGFQPRKNEKGVITISPLYFNDADIRPSTSIPILYCFYPPPERLNRALFALGYNDTVRYLKKHGMSRKLKAQEELRKQKQNEGEKHHEEAEEDNNNNNKKNLYLPVDKDAFKFERSRFGFLIDKTLDLFFFFFYFLLRFMSMFLIYGELFLVGTLSFWATLFHEFFPSTFERLFPSKSYVFRAVRSGEETGRKEAAKDLWSVFRNVISMRTWLHLALGFRSVNKTRLSKYSRVYRMMNPIVSGGGGGAEGEGKKKD